MSNQKNHKCVTYFGSDLKRFQPSFKSSQLDCENLFMRYKLEKRLRSTLTLTCLVGDWKRRRWLQRITREQFVRWALLTNEFTRLPWSCYLRLGGRPANYSFEMVLYGCKFWSDAEFQNFGVLIECSCLILKLRGSNNSLIDHVTRAWVAVPQTIHAKCACARMKMQNFKTMKF